MEQIEGEQLVPVAALRSHSVSLDSVFFPYKMLWRIRYPTSLFFFLSVHGVAFPRAINFSELQESGNLKFGVQITWKLFIFIWVCLGQRGCCKSCFFFFPSCFLWYWSCNTEPCMYWARTLSLSCVSSQDFWSISTENCCRILVRDVLYFSCCGTFI